MDTIHKQYIVDEQNHKIAVQMDIQTFERIEEILENHALVQLMKEEEPEETFTVHQAKKYVNQLDKAD